MKILKKVLIVVAVIILLPFIIAIFIPRTYTVTVTENINQPKQVVYDYMRKLDNQKKYSIWVMADPQLNPEIIGTDGTIGAIQKWNSKDDNVGEGEQEITSLTGDRMEVDLRFKRPFEGHARAANNFEAVSPATTKVTTQFYSDDKYPFNLPSYLFGRKMIEEAQTKNLANLKKNLEQGQ